MGDDDEVERQLLEAWVARADAAAAVGAVDGFVAERGQRGEHGLEVVQVEEIDLELQAGDGRQGRAAAELLDRLGEGEEGFRAREAPGVLR